MQAVRTPGLPIHNTNSQYNLPEIQKNLRVALNREGIAERFADPSVSKSIELDLNLIDLYDQELGKIERYIQKQAKACDMHSLILLRTVPGIGEILVLVILYEIHTIDRFPTVQDFSSYCRLVKCKKESAVLFLRQNLPPLKPGWKKSPIGITKPGP